MRCYITCVVLMLLSPLIAGASSHNSIEQGRQLMAKSTLCFIANEGQVKDLDGNVCADIDYKFSAPGMDIFIGRARLYYQLHSPAPGKGKGKAEAYGVEVKLRGASTHGRAEMEDPLDYYENYYGAGGEVITAHACRKIRYRNIYPGIDWVLYVRNNELEYDFVVSETGNVNDIRLSYNGATAMKMDEAGNLLLRTPLGEITEQAPVAYQQDGREVPVKYKREGNDISFCAEAYKGILTIDPVLKWATYYGGLQNDLFEALACDTLGNIYLAGFTYSTSGIATPAAFQTTTSGGGFIVKFDSTGNRLWGTYYGAGTPAYSQCTDICVGPFGELYVAGYTTSNNGYATALCHQPVYGGAQDAFLVKFSDAGIRLWGTYYGGTALEESGGVSCDDQGNVYLAGETASDNNIASVGAYKTAKNSFFTDGFLAKFDSAGVRQWATYFGGSGNDEINDISYDRNIGGMYVCGATASVDSIATPGAYQVVYGGGALDAFIAKFDDAGNRLWATYYGGNAIDSGARVIGNEGLIYLAGETASSNGIATAGSYQTNYGGGSYDGFLARFDINGQLKWGTYYGGNSLDVCEGLALSNGGADIFIAGRTNSVSNVATSGSHQDVYGAGATDAFLAKFQDLGNASALVWATYYGGTDKENNANVACDNSDNVYLGGGTYSQNAIATPGSFKDSIYPGQMDAFLARFRNCDPPAQPDTITGPLYICPGSTQTFTASIAAGATSYTWVLPPGWSGGSNTNSISITPGDAGGSIVVIALNGCDGSDPTALTVQVYPQPHPLLNVSGNLLATGAYSAYQWYRNGLPVAAATGQTYTYSLQGDYYVHVTDANGCEGNSDTLTLWATGLPYAAAGTLSINAWPNPVADRLCIGDLSVGTLVQILAPDGRLLREETILQGKCIVDVHDLPSGSYILHVQVPGGNCGRLLFIKE